ncbi:MAG: phenylacetic acid degradation b [Cyclobacteriaceae bacterium]|nr:phenylacetic acid degradation b [Cyclobacteriaceae bacterium]
MKDSLDPRIKPLERENYLSKSSPDQLHTYEVFVQPKEGKPYEHVGIVHAADLEMAFVFAKELFSRRNSCVGMWVVKTSDVWVTEYTEGEDNIFSHFEKNVDGGEIEYEVFLLPKRGKQHRHVSRVKTKSPDAAIGLLYHKDSSLKGYNVWVCESEKFFKSNQEIKQIWDTLPDKGFRDALAYKAGDKLKNFLKK